MTSTGTSSVLTTSRITSTLVFFSTIFSFSTMTSTGTSSVLTTSRITSTGTSTSTYLTTSLGTSLITSTLTSLMISFSTTSIRFSPPQSQQRLWQSLDCVCGCG